MTKKTVRLGRLLFLLLTITIAIIMLSFNNEENIIKNLISDRVTILNNYYFNNESKNKSINLLKKIENGYLLEEDIKVMDTYLNTDIEEVNTFQISNVEVNHDAYNTYFGTYSIIWRFPEEYNETDETMKYKFTARVYSNRIKLTNIKKI